MVLGPFLAFFMVKDGRSVMNLVFGISSQSAFRRAGIEPDPPNQFSNRPICPCARILESVIVGFVTGIGTAADFHFPMPVFTWSFRRPD